MKTISTLLLTLAMLSPALAADCLRLHFNSLPSAQGWWLRNSPPSEDDDNTYFVDDDLNGAFLVLDSFGTSFGIDNQVPTNQPYSLTIRARVLRNSGPSSFRVRIENYSGINFYSLTTNQIRILTRTGFQTNAFDTTQFHTYRLDSLSGAWARLYVDGVLLAEWEPCADGDDNDLMFGVDPDSFPPLSSTRVEIRQFEFCRRQGPTLSASVASIDVCWDSLSNRLYQVQYRSSLTTNQWTNLGIPVAGNGATNCITDTVRGEPQRFYRAVETPQ